MSEYSYLFGRLLKVADEIQRLYCSVVRNGQMPTQFVASMLFQSAMETPGRTLPLLALRLSPYISWAKSYAYKDQSESGNESWRARWLLRIFEEISEKLYDNWTEDKYMNDNEKALMFLGYMAKLPKSKIHNEENYEMEENNDE